SSQALPRAVRHDLSRAAGTSFVIRGNVTAAQGARYTSLLPGKISAALEGAPFTFYRAYRSNPLGFVAGSRPAAPGNTRTDQIIEADMLQLRDRISDRLIRFTVTGLYRPRQVSSPYWGLNDVALSGSTTISGFTTYGPLTVTAAAFRGPLTMDGGSWVAVPRTADIPAG